MTRIYYYRWSDEDILSRKGVSMLMSCLVWQRFNHAGYYKINFAKATYECMKWLMGMDGKCCYCLPVQLIWIPQMCTRVVISASAYICNKTVSLFSQVCFSVCYDLLAFLITYQFLYLTFFGKRSPLPLIFSHHPFWLRLVLSHSFSY